MKRKVLISVGVSLQGIIPTCHFLLPRAFKMQPHIIGLVLTCPLKQITGAALPLSKSCLFPVLMYLPIAVIPHCQRCYPTSWQRHKPALLCHWVFIFVSSQAVRFNRQDTRLALRRPKSFVIVIG